MIKSKMIDVIIRMLYNVDEVSGPAMDRTFRGYMRWSKDDVATEYEKAMKIKLTKTAASHNAKVEAGTKKLRLYHALDHTGKRIITVLAQNAYLARGEVLEQLSRNPSRRPYKEVWRKGHCALKTNTGITLYYCYNMNRYVTIPEGGDDA